MKLGLQMFIYNLGLYLYRGTLCIHTAGRRWWKVKWSSSAMRPKRNMPRRHCWAWQVGQLKRWGDPGIQDLRAPGWRLTKRIVLLVCRARSLALAHGLSGLRFNNKKVHLRWERETFFLWKHVDITITTRVRGPGRT